jgi:hypothetical protein
MKPPHKFFERFLDNDLDSLYNYLYKLNEDMKEGNFPGITKKEAMFSGVGTSTVYGSSRYNILTFDHPGLKNLHKAIYEMSEEACNYYGYDFNSQEYYIESWFNFDTKENDKHYVFNKQQMHEHLGGTGFPLTHGYYCVNAEPSVTYYNIDKKGVIFENVNINNRAILSETSHPHVKGKWSEEKPRITIAYDIVTKKEVDVFRDQGATNWIPLKIEI